MLEQTIEANAVRLQKVAITCDSVSAANTRVSLRIEFEPLIRPRWYWRWYEPLFGGVAMNAVLDAWQANVENPHSVVRR